MRDRSQLYPSVSSCRPRVVFQCRQNAVIYCNTSLSFDERQIRGLVYPTSSQSHGTYLFDALLLSFEEQRAGDVNEKLT